MVGGGKDAFIGSVHRIALRLDGYYELVAGSFSSDFENSKETGKNLGLENDRIYKTYQEMAEKESVRPDGIDVVSIVTPIIYMCLLQKSLQKKGYILFAISQLVCLVRRQKILKKLLKVKN